jgi:hypothetical protein
MTRPDIPRTGHPNETCFQTSYRLGFAFSEAIGEFSHAPLALNRVGHLQCDLVGYSHLGAVARDLNVGNVAHLMHLTALPTGPRQVSVCSFAKSAMVIVEQRQRLLTESKRWLTAISATIMDINR